MFLLCFLIVVLDLLFIGELIKRTQAMTNLDKDVKKIYSKIPFQQLCYYSITKKAKFNLFHHMSGYADTFCAPFTIIVT